MQITAKPIKQTYLKEGRKENSEWVQAWYFSLELIQINCKYKLRNKIEKQITF